MAKTSAEKVQAQMDYLLAKAKAVSALSNRLRAQSQAKPKRPAKSNGTSNGK
jgi:hypothetical protein